MKILAYSADCFRGLGDVFDGIGPWLLTQQEGYSG
jgi:hypothetical protein